MTRDEAVAQIKLLLGFRKTLDTTIVEQMKNVQSQLESDATLPWFLRRNSVGIATSPGNPFINKPVDFIREWDEDPLYLVYTNTEGNYRVNLIKDSESYLTARYAMAEAPAGYAEIGEQWKLIPTPVEILTVYLSYYARALSLNTNIENAWLKYNSDIIIGRTGLLIATGLRDKAAMEVFGALAAAGTEKINQQSTAQDEAGTRRIIGGED